MQWFRNLKIAGKIGAGFALLVVLTLISAGVSMNALRSVRASSVDMATNWLPALVALGEVDAAEGNLRSRQLKRMLVTTDAEVAKVENERDVLLKELTETKNAYEKTITGAEEKALFDAYDQQLTAYLSIADSIFAKAGSDRAAAVLWTSRAGVPADSAANLIQAIVKFNVDGADKAADIATAQYGRTLWILGGLVAFCAVAALISGLFVTRAVTGPLGLATRTLEQVAGGDLTRRLQVDSRDEVGQMATSLNTALESLSSAMSSIAQNASALASSSEELNAVSTQMGQNATETSSQANMVSAAAEQVSRNVQTVATGTEEMTASIREIAKNASDAARVASSAVSVADTTNASVAKLGVSSAEIGNVIKVITSIAQQTNLLALNATIEAARAGEAGKGFAVVANEVKELAKETAKATEDISRKIEAIQGDTTDAVNAIGQIGAIIAQINDAQTTIASAVEEQTATTNEMARNVEEASKGSSEIAQNITIVAQAAEGTNSGATDTQTASGELARMASELQSVVSRFKFAETLKRAA